VSDPTSIEVDNGTYFGDDRYQEVSDEAAVGHLEKGDDIRLWPSFEVGFELRATRRKCDCWASYVYDVEVVNTNAWFTAFSLRPCRTPDEAVDMMRAIAEGGISVDVVLPVADKHGKRSGVKATQEEETP